MTTRRNFIKLSAAGVLGTCSFNLPACSLMSDNSGIGLQLYSIRDAMSENPLESLKKVSKLGYRYLELANYNDGKFYGYAPSELKKIVADLGMEVISSHTQVEAKGVTMDNAKMLVEDHAEMGVKYCVQPWVNPEDRTVDKYKQMIGDWNKVGEMMRKVGIQFAYHNHNFEFDNLNGITPYFDIFMPELDQELVTMELDMFWVSKAGYNPVDLFKRFPGRFQLFHFKDMGHKEGAFFDVSKNDIAPVGEGTINFKDIYDARKLAGMKYTFVEDDNQGNGDAFKSISTSINNLKSMFYDHR